MTIQKSASGRVRSKKSRERAQQPGIKIAASILSADFARLGEQVREADAAGADFIHVDVMDGHFVPNITFGPLVVTAIRPFTRLPLGVHLMIEEPEKFIGDFAEAGADIITVQQEACVHLHRVVTKIKEAGMRTGVAINPATPVGMLEEILPFLDFVLVMTVDPGFGGQSFIPTMPRKIRAARQMIDRQPKRIELAVDGGIHPETAPSVVKAGASVIVAGSAIFNSHESVDVAIKRLRESVRQP